MILAQRLRRASAPHAARWHRQRGCIWCGWTIDAQARIRWVGKAKRAHRTDRRATPRGHGARAPLPTLRASPEIAVENAAVDRGEISGRNPLVDFVHGGVHEAELDHRAIVLDEARIRGAARGRELGLAP